MQNTRQRILKILKTQHQVSAPELSRILDLTEANIRHHLDQLQQDGHIEVIGQTKAGGRGRPTNIYMLTKTAQDNALDELASALLKEIQNEKITSQRLQKLSIIARHLTGMHLDTHKSITIQLGKAVQRLNELNYNAHWEARATSPQIILGRCPYAQIINRHPELCMMDTLMLNQLTGAEFSQVEKISRSQDGPIHCRFVMKQS